MIELINANSLQIPLADQSVHMVVTSPPYWALRDYGTARWQGGDPECDHKVTHYNDNLKPNVDRVFRGDRSACIKCGAVRIDAQLGLEATPELYVENMVQVFREVWRVLRDDGVLYLNIGDSYAGGSKDPNPNGKQGTNKGTVDFEPGQFKGYVPSGLKPKDLVGIPWRLAFALQADGWYLRSDIIWHKPNPMPESVTDRPTKSHEYVFLLSKSQRYFWDQEAVREAQYPASLERLKRGWNGNGDRGYPNGPQNHIKNYMGKTDEEIANLPGRNQRDVWTIATQPYPGSHFATFPEKLVEPCIKAGTSERGCCPHCGKQWERVVEDTPEYAAIKASQDWKANRGETMLTGVECGRSKTVRTTKQQVTLGFRPTCSCPEHEPIPSTVLDPFAGSGTTLLVARALGRSAVGTDLSFDYLSQQARARLILDSLDDWTQGKASEAGDHDLGPLFRMAG